MVMPTPSLEELKQYRKDIALLKRTGFVNPKTLRRAIKRVKQFSFKYGTHHGA